MMTYNPIFRSPITKSQLPHQASNLQLFDLTGVQVTLIQGEVGDGVPLAAVPVKPGEVVETAGGLLARLTPANLYWFGLSPATKLPSMAELDDTFARNGRFAHATDLTHGKAVLKLVGAASRDVLSKICGLDFDERKFPNLHAAQTSAAKIKTLIVRADQAGLLTYFLQVERSLGQYFWEVVWDAGQEFGISSPPAD
ncbi:MAG: sarcosine oxidase subunit gamma family protein [Anaerolineae bacterium]